MSDGITLQTHPMRLSDADLRWLSELCDGVIGTRAPALARWLWRWCDSERQRRVVTQLAEPLEPQMPSFNAARWSGRDLSDGLQASFALLQLAGQHPAIAELARQIHQILIIWAGGRLERQTKDS